MPGGLDNPLGARTLYLYQNGVYTLYTIYSTSDPETIGTGLTSGCTGLLTSGHDRPLFTNAGQDEGGRPAGIGDGVGPPVQARRRGQAKAWPFVRVIAIVGVRRSLVVCPHDAASNVRCQIVFPKSGPTGIGR